jgi:hypothetical protein
MEATHNPNDLLISPTTTTSKNTDSVVIPLNPIEKYPTFTNLPTDIVLNITNRNNHNHSSSSLATFLTYIKQRVSGKVYYIIICMIFIVVLANLLTGLTAKDSNIVAQATKSFIYTLYSVFAPDNPTTSWQGPKTGAIESVAGSQGQEQQQKQPILPQKGSKEFIMMQVIRDRLAALSPSIVAPPLANTTSKPQEAMSSNS